jgi:WD40 repeat protein
MVWRKRVVSCLRAVACIGLVASVTSAGSTQSRLHEVSLRWVAPTLYPLQLSAHASGTHAAVGLGYGLVGWLNLNTGAVERTLSTGRFLPIAAIELRGNLLMIADNGDLTAGGSVIDLWDVATWRQLRRILSPQPITAATLSPNAQYIATIGRDRAVRIWRVSDGTLQTTVYQAFIPLSVTFTADSARVITGDDRGYLRMWTVSGTYLGIVRVLGSGVNRLGVSPNNGWLIVGATNAESRALGYNLSTNSVGWYAPYWGGVTGIAFSPNSAEVYIGSTDAYVYRHNLNTGQRLGQFAARTSVQSLSIASNAGVVVSGSFHFPYADNFPFIIYQDYNLALVQVWGATGALLRTFRGDLTRPVRIAVAHSGNLLAVGDFEGNLYLYDKAAGQQLRYFPAHMQEVRGVAISATGQYLASCDANELKVWDVSNPINPTLLFTYTPSDSGFVSLAFSPNGQRVAVGHVREGLSLLEIPSGNLIANIQGGEERFVPTALDFSPDSQTLAVGGRMQGIFFYDANAGELIQSRPTEDITLRLQYSADGTKLLIVEGNNSTYVVDLPTDTELGRHGESWEDARLTYEGTKVVAIRYEDSLVLWDYANDQPDQYRRLLRFGRHLTAHGDVAVDSDGRTLYTSFANHGIAAWRLPSPADIDGNGCVDDADLLTVLFNFGATGANPADVNRDSTVDDADLLQVLFNFGDGC